MPSPNKSLPTLGLLYLDHVLRFFDVSNFKGWPNKIEKVTYHWGNDKQRFINEVKRKKIDVLIGNIPATAYETFREIARALPEVRFIPSMDTQFCNKSKENVTHFCRKYDLSAPNTHIFYEPKQAIEYFKTATFPKIIKRSYGPSNYGGYFVHKVDSFEEALALHNKRKYYPTYVQDFVPMKADIRVMVIGHQPVCAFWRRPPEGEWLTNTSQGGSMDYQDVPDEALQLAVATSKAAKAEYWACDIAVSQDDQYSILECATAFAAFPYIRDWIGQYLMWQLAPQLFKKPHFLHRNWEELGKMDSSILRVMRHITFGRPCYSTDTGELSPYDSTYPLLHSPEVRGEEWPSELWNFQDNYGKSVTVLDMIEPEMEHLDTGIEDNEVLPLESLEPTAQHTKFSITHDELFNFLVSIKGVGRNLANDIISSLGVEATVHALNHDPSQLTNIRNLKQKKLTRIVDKWSESELTT
ncbi:hypothetical protein MHO82_23200 [Vibrio sp. Of7-15]|uniref:ATP-grasp domain-containing protein n=1 Tax=Vibrio sp. Of7-15 TaxID=2724879 RepID=UPI001EF2DE52|nr:hypothetical protein [Vibrio sp. Of7-15]MCG7499778.1 hypothetical protein [Vibrio sp. Of7-15]